MYLTFESFGENDCKDRLQTICAYHRIGYTNTEQCSHCLYLTIKSQHHYWIIDIASVQENIVHYIDTSFFSDLSIWSHRYFSDYNFCYAAPTGAPSQKRMTRIGATRIVVLDVVLIDLLFDEHSDGAPSCQHCQKTPQTARRGNNK